MRELPTGDVSAETMPLLLFSAARVKVLVILPAQNFSSEEKLFREKIDPAT